VEAPKAALAVELAADPEVVRGAEEGVDPVEDLALVLDRAPDLERVQGLAVVVALVVAAVVAVLKKREKVSNRAPK
jgi:hypothetical protein